MKMVAKAGQRAMSASTYVDILRKFVVDPNVNPIAARRHYAVSPDAKDSRNQLFYPNR